MLGEYYDDEYSINTFNENIQRRGVDDNFVDLNVTKVEVEVSERENLKSYKFDPYIGRDRIPDRVIGNGKTILLEDIYKSDSKIVIYGTGQVRL